MHKEPQHAAILRQRSVRDQGDRKRLILKEHMSMLESIAADDLQARDNKLR